MRLLIIFIFLFIDLFFNVTFAQSANNESLFSFAPPASDASLVYLSNLFGVVDGVLAGTGSQIFGHMMGVFNTGVLAISSITTTYVLVLGTVHTAHEGEFLGKQWSSIMIPLRITAAMALLAPKLSGYCALQIIFMWVVVQGVGAADKIWNAALSYLNQGGQLVSQQMSSGSITRRADTVQENTTPQFPSGRAWDNQDTIIKHYQQDPVYIGAGKMLSGIVCMYGLQQWIANLQSTNCQNNTSQFCKATPPNFLNSVDAVTFAKDNSSNPLQLPMPNIQNDPNFGFLSGVCGTINWAPIKTDFSEIVGGDSAGANNTTVQTTRNIAVQTMYTFLMNVGMAIINNDPVFNTSLAPSVPPATADAAPYAKMQFGGPLDMNGAPCWSLKDGCTTWGPVIQNGATVMFSGNEFLNAILAYYGVMQPYFSLVQQKNDTTKKSAAQQNRAFIADAQNFGWMYAGAYFFKLINLSNSNVMTGPMKHDDDSKLSDSQDSIDQTDPTKKFPDTCVGKSATTIGSFCWIISQSGSLTDTRPLINLQRLISGAVVSTVDPNNSCGVTLKFNPNNADPESGKGYILAGDSSFQNIANQPACISTVYGFIGNSAFFNVTGSSKEDPAAFSFEPPGFAYRGINLSIDALDCSFFKLGNCIGNVFIYLLNAITTSLMLIVSAAMNAVIGLLIIAPMKFYLFPMIQKGMAMLTTQSLNPVVKLANMGAYFIQNSIECYFSLMPVSMIAALGSVGPMLGGFAVAVGMMLTMTLPIITTWMAYFVSVGVTTAYYVPLVPYMIFLFGVIGWFFSVIESMIAAPLVALILTSPEGEGLVGKGETGIMILMNVFLRPSLMIIGFVSGIMMSTISVWILTATFKTAADYLLVSGLTTDKTVATQLVSKYTGVPNTDISEAYQGYGGLDWGKYPFANLLGSFFYIVTFVSVYVTLTQKAFSLIHNVPDKVMRWIGGTQESYGQDTSQWTEETKGAISDAGKKAFQGIGDAAARPAKALEDKVKADKEREKAGSGSVAADANAGPGAKKQAPP